jgi:hypothetical protein
MLSMGAVVRGEILTPGLVYQSGRVWLPSMFFDAEKRLARRYSLDLELTYTVVLKGKPVDSGSGRSIDWSSAGLRFVAERPIGVGLKLQLAARWPLTLDDGVQLKLVVSGKTVRTLDRETAVSITRYEFRTCGLSGNGRPFEAAQPGIACGATQDAGREPARASAGNAAG